MTTIDIKDVDGKVAGTAELSDYVFIGFTYKF